MWKAYLKFDQKIISIFQDGYLWLLDRTGIYVATIGFVLYAIAAAMGILVLNSLSPWFWLAALGFIGLTGAHKYLLQDKGEYDRLNYAAMMLEGMVIRHVFDITLWMFLVSDLIILEPLRAIHVSIFLAFGYTALIKVRARDKRPFFKPAEDKTELAYQNGSD